MPEQILREAMREVAANLRASFSTTKLLSHAPTKGDIREDRVIEAFRRHLPTRVHVSRGVIVNASGEQSQQQDVIVTDALASAPFTSSPSVAVHPIEAVLASI